MSTSVIMVVRLFNPWIGGMERQAMALARNLVETGTPVQLLTGRWFPRTRARETIEGVSIVRHTTARWIHAVKGGQSLGAVVYMFSLLWQLWRRRSTYDVIHVHGLSYHTAICVVAGRLTGRPVMAKLANSGEASDIAKMRTGAQLRGSRLLLPLALGADGYVALNPLIETELVAAGVGRERIVAIPNGVDAHRPHGPKAKSPDEPVRVVYVGRLHPQKQIGTLIEAVAQLPDVTLRIVGDGPARSDLEVEAEPVGDRIVFVGELPDPSVELEAADIFVLPSAAEGLSNALLEAMSCSLPVVVSDLPGNRQVVREGVEGLLVPVGDASALADALQQMASEVGLRTSMGRNARARVIETFDLRAVAGRYRHLYDEIREIPAVVAGKGDGR